jgi:dTDP-4-amino-4,6-dideoxygalactose transaminase
VLAAECRSVASVPAPAISPVRIARRPIVRFQTPEMPPMADVQRYFALAEDERFYSNGGPCWRLLSSRLRVRLEGAPATIPVASATAGLLVALRAALGEADGRRRYVVTPSFTFTATACAIAWAGFTPLFADIEPDGWQLDPAALEAELAARPGEIAGVLACSTFGTVAEPALRSAWRAICEAHDVPLVIDSAAAFGACDTTGATAGALGDPEVFSFHATKPFAIGEGGLVTIPDPEVAQRAQRLTNFGLDDVTRVTLEIGLNAKLSELHCAVALAVLDGYDDVLARRRATAAELRARLAEHPLGYQRDSERSTMQVFPVLLRDVVQRDAALEAAEVIGVQVRTMFDPPLHRHPAFAGAAAGDLSVTDDVASRLLALPCANTLEEWQLERIAAVAGLACA